MDPGIANHTLPEEFEEVVVPEMLEKEVGAKVDVKPTLTTSSPAPSYIELIDPGVHNIEIYAEMYNRPIYRVALFFSLFLIAYAYGLDGNIRYTFQAYATSSYSQHSLLSTVNCIKTVSYTHLDVYKRQGYFLPNVFQTAFSKEGAFATLSPFVVKHLAVQR